MFSLQREMPSQLERYELKFMIPFDMVAPVSEFAMVYCSPDKYSNGVNDGFYTVNSLYLDSPGYHFLKMRIDGAQNRFNMRVRSYGEKPDVPYFLEVKQKTCGVIRKYRSTVTDKEWYRAYTEPGHRYDEKCSGTEEKNRQLFERLVYTYNAAPVILTQYLRKAFVSDVDDYARITFDTALKFREEKNYRPDPGNLPMIASDHTLAFDPGCEVVLELKCYASSVPMWMLDMIRYFNLKRRRFSKYLTGASELFGLYSHDASSRLSPYNNIQ